MRDILSTIAKWWDSGETFGLATVVDTFSSAPRDPGAAPRLAGTRSYSDFGWYPLTELPANMIDRARVAVRNYAAGGRFSTYPAFGM